MSVSAVHHPQEYELEMAAYRRKTRKQVAAYAAALRELHEEHERSIQEMLNIRKGGR